MMFRFRLEKVLQQRRRAVEARGRDLALARANLARRQQAHDQAAHELHRSREAAALARAGNALDVAALSRATAWHDRREAEVAALAAAVAAAAGEVAAARERLTAAWRDQEVLIRLRARQEQQWRQEQARRERRELDEIGSIRAALAGGERTPETNR